MAGDKGCYACSGHTGAGASMPGGHLGEDTAAGVAHVTRTPGQCWWKEQQRNTRRRVRAPLGSQDWVAERIAGLPAGKGGIVGEGEAEMISLASGVLSSRQEQGGE